MAGPSQSAVELHVADGPALSDGGAPAAARDTVRLLDQPDDGTDRCVGVTCKPQVSSLAAASLGMNGIFFGMLIVLTVGRSSHRAPPEQPPSSSALAQQGDRAVADRSRAACGGHGIFFDEAEACLCFDCWRGATCSEQLSGSACVVQAASGTPFLFEDYWLAHPEATMVVRPSYHLGYNPSEHNPLTGESEIRALPRLERAVREVHDLVGNALLDGTHLVVGEGSTALVNAALYALAKLCADRHGTGAARARSPAAAVWAARPYYSGYREPSSYFETSLFEWEQSDTPPTASPERPVIEMVTAPNNPDGMMRKARVAPSEHAYAVHDHAYYWPTFSPIGTPVTDQLTNRSVALFTLSKLSGHASTRIGWAVCRCPRVAALMRQFIRLSTVHVPRESQLRAAVVLEHVVRTKGEIFDYGRSLMAARWQRLQASFSGSTLFELQKLEPASKDSFGSAEATGTEHQVPSPAYAWVKQLDGGNATATMEAAGIVGRPGTRFGTGANFVRLELLMREQTFELLVKKLRRMHGPQGQP